MSVPAMTPYDAWLESHIVGDSLVMRRLRAMVARVARSPLPVLISGPTGAGKELVAEAIHRISGRTGALVAVNICALGDSMFESALFGHVRGAFTGAVADAIGLVSEADRGTLFLDEIGALPTREQAKLLRVLETRTYRPVGASRDRASDFRLVTATNEDLDEAVEGSRFRGDLRYRLGKLVLRIPPLQERRGDIPVLVRHFIEGASPAAPVVVDDRAMDVLVAYEWPGNVRELRSVMNMLLLLGDGAPIVRSDVLGAIDRRPVSQPKEPEREALTRLLVECDWDTSLAATELGIHRVTVYRRMRAFGIRVPAHTRKRSEAARMGETQICANVHADRANGSVIAGESSQ
jgi:DNA-binding NtrC family response regulator